MANRQRLIGLGTRRGERLTAEFGETVAEARVGLGLTMREVGETIGVSHSQIWRVEHAMPPYLDFIQAARLAQVLGLDLSVRCYPNGAAIRDIAHARLIVRFCEAIRNVRWSLEVPIPLPRDLRAWDILGTVGSVRVGVAAETRLRDAQALLRREKAKMRDANVDRLVLLLWSTRANRATLREIREELRPDLPLDTRQVLGALRAGRDPGANGIVLL